MASIIFAPSRFYFPPTSTALRFLREDSSSPQVNVVEEEKRRQQRESVQTKRHKKKKNFIIKNDPAVSIATLTFFSKIKP